MEKNERNQMETSSAPNSPQEKRCRVYFEDRIETVVTENSYLTIKDLYNSYWRCRDFELDHLWQRSVFLTAFLVLCFSAYGILEMNMITSLKESTDFMEKIIYWLVVNACVLAVSTIGIILANLWLMMSKASKAWYEVYEKAIKAYELDTKHYIKGDSAFEKIAGFNYCQQEKYEKLIFDEKLDSSAGGAYSPSRINWAIGAIILRIWQCIMAIHLFFLFCIIYIIGIREQGADISWWYFTVGTAIFLAGLAACIYFSKSTKLKEKVSSEILTKIRNKSHESKIR